MCATPLTFHAHRHIMFISYMPFLVMGFYGIDRYFKNKSFLLILAISLMIFTSYYFSVSGLVVLFIFGIYKYLKYNKFKFKSFISFSLKMVIRFIIGILIGAVIILPTLYVLFNGRGDTVTSSNLLNLLKPNMYLLYSPYSIGLTLISLVAVLFMFFKGKEGNRFLSIIIILVSVFPLFNYILNGFLYIDSKSLIPFIPLVLILFFLYF